MIILDKPDKRVTLPDVGQLVYLHVKEFYVKSTEGLYRYHKLYGWLYTVGETLVWSDLKGRQIKDTVVGWQPVTPTAPLRPLEDIPEDADYV